MSRLLRVYACTVAAALILHVAPARAQIFSGPSITLSDEIYKIRQQASFEIWSGKTRLGTEKFRIYASNDTLVATSTTRFDGASPTSRLPFEKHSMLLARAYDSYPLAFQITEQSRKDSVRTVSLNCDFRDTVVTIFKESERRGVGTSVALPPGRLYLFEPGIYLQVQLLLADFLAGSQDTRKQAVLIPSAEQVVDLELTRGPTETMVVHRKKISAQRVDLTDNQTNLVGWVDKDGRMWRLEAPGQGLRVERGPDLEANSAGAPAPAVKKPARHRKRAAMGGAKR